MSSALCVVAFGDRQQALALRPRDQLNSIVHIPTSCRASDCVQSVISYREARCPVRNSHASIAYYYNATEWSTVKSARLGGGEVEAALKEDEQSLR